MTPDRFRELIHSLGLSQVAAGRFLGIDERTSRRWASDDKGIPDPVAMLLELMVKTRYTPARVRKLIDPT